LKGHNASSSVGSRVSTATAQPGTATPVLTIPSSCKGSSASDIAELMLCEHGQETIINITTSLTVQSITSPGKKPQTGTVNVTFLRAYADRSRLILVYKINSVPTPAIEWSGFGTLSTQQGDVSANSGGFGTGYQVQSFDASSLPARITKLQVKKIITEAGSSVSLAFTLPFHSASKTVTVKQTATNKGYTLTLNQLVLTGSTTTFALTATYQPLQKTYVTNFEIQAITINGQNQQLTFPGGPGVGPGVGTATSLTGSCSFYQSWLDQPGSWTVTVVLVKEKQVTGSVPSPVVTGTFTFTVPV